jgi:hypothetical protein
MNEKHYHKGYYDGYDEARHCIECHDETPNPMSMNMADRAWEHGYVDGFNRALVVLL